MDETPNNPVEAMVRDGAEAQRQNGLIPAPNAVKDFILPIIEKGERMEEESRLRIKPKKETIEAKPSIRRSTEEMEKEFKVRLARKGHEPLPGPSGWTETRKPIDVYATHRQFLNKREALQKTRLRKRIRLLLSKPDWRAKMMEVNPLALNGQLGIEKQQAAEAYVRKVIRDSCAVFGEWMAEPKKKLWFT